MGPPDVQSAGEQIFPVDYGCVLFLVSFGVTAIVEIDIKAHRERALIEPVGRLPYEVPVVDLALQDRLAVVLLERGVSVVDVADWRAPRESGRAEIEGWRLWRLALSGSTAYVWGSSEGARQCGGRRIRSQSARAPATASTAVSLSH